MKIRHTENRLIILDEATSSLDCRAERKIFDRFLEISREKGQTLVIVTHRLAHLAHHADQILCVLFLLLYLFHLFNRSNLLYRFMKDGKIEEKGTHQELMECSQGRYAGLYSSETAAS